MLYIKVLQKQKKKFLLLNFDKMWKQIFKHGHEYPNLKSLVNAIISLPNSNANSERIFSLLPDLKTKKRNSLSSVTVNASCILQSALKARKETALEMKINAKHLSLMSAENLYSTCPKRQKSHLTLYAADDNEIASSSSNI